MWINALGGLYTGDMAAGERAATQAEIDAWRAALEAARPDRSNLATHDKTVRVLARLLATELNITPAPARAKFAAAWTAENGGDGR